MVKRNKLGQFTSECLRGNKFALGNKPNKTSFKKGNLPHNYKNGVQKHNNWGYVYYDINNKNRIALSRKIYQENIGDITNGWIIYHKDGDKFNNNINNLETISRAELLRRNSYGK